MGKVSAPKVVTAVEASESPLPPRIQEALGELVGAAREACWRSAWASGSASCTN